MYDQKIASYVLGKEPAPMVLKHAVVFNVFTGEWLPGDIALCEDKILGVGTYEGTEEIDLGGKYVVPGFIDAHLHLESTLLNPYQIISQAVLQGTTGFVIDPHEAANVSGMDGIQYIMDDAGRCEANVFVMMPSCVPSLPFEKNGVTINAEQMKTLMDHPGILGLGEVMNVPAVLNCSEEMLKKLSLFKERGRVLDGHGGNLDEKSAACYSFAGIRTDHECTTYEDAMREARAGMHILVREGTAARNVEAIVKGIVEHHTPTDSFSFCTDDKHIEDIIENGHISYNIRRAIELGLKPEEAYKMATINTARCYRLGDLGAIAPGYQADLVVLDDYKAVKVNSVYHKGKLVTAQKDAAEVHMPAQTEKQSCGSEAYAAENDPECGHASEQSADRDSRKRCDADFVPAHLTDTVHISYAGREVFRIPVSQETQPIICAVPGEILTDGAYEKVPVKDGYFEPDETYQKLLVFERHHETGMVGKGIIRGFSLTGGALASTVGHDSHNLIVIGDDDASMEAALQALVKSHGGYAVVKKGEEPLVQPLEIMGLMTAQPHEEVAVNLKQMIECARSLGIPQGIDPFITMSFLSLPVIPKVRLTPLGIYHVLEDSWDQVK